MKYKIITSNAKSFYPENRDIFMLYENTPIYRVLDELEGHTDQINFVERNYKGVTTLGVIVGSDPELLSCSSIQLYYGLENNDKKFFRVVFTKPGSRTYILDCPDITEDVYNFTCNGRQISEEDFVSNMHSLIIGRIMEQCD